VNRDGTKQRSGAATFPSPPRSSQPRVLPAPRAREGRPLAGSRGWERNHHRVAALGAAGQRAVSPSLALRVLVALAAS